MKTIAISTIKGGSAKTTTAAALLQAGAYKGLKCIGVDLDGQASLTHVLDADQRRAGALDLLHGQEVSEVVQHTSQGIDCIAGAPDLSAETTRTGSAARLRAALRPIEDLYDLCIIDLPPRIGEMLYNAITAADGLIIPLEADQEHLQGLYQSYDVACQMQAKAPNMRILGAVITRYDQRTKISQRMYEVIQETCDELGIPLLQAIRQTVSVQEARMLHQSLYEYAPESTAAADYMELYEKIMEVV